MGHVGPTWTLIYHNRHVFVLQHVLPLACENCWQWMWNILPVGDADVYGQWRVNNGVLAPTSLASFFNLSLYSIDSVVWSSHRLVQDYSIPQNNHGKNLRNIPACSLSQVGIGFCYFPSPAFSEKAPVYFGFLPIRNAIPFDFSLLLFRH